MVGEGVSEDKLTVPVVVITEVEIVGTIAEGICIGCIVGLTGMHPAKAKVSTQKIDNGFIIEAFLSVLRF